MTAPATSTPGNVVPSEVGWQFVPQYYTFVNKQPDRLHLFYTKQSTFIHGVEGEDGKPCHGQQEIHQKITSLGYNDCKVFIHSVDAQSSADGGIIIQVIGEMSNQNEEWRKFVQTFFLAQQPNGYFVLNDIFRFLKEEAVESDEAREGSDSEPAPAQQASAPVVAEPVAEPKPVPTAAAREPTPPPPPPVVRPATPPPAVEEPPTTVSDIPASPPASPRPNGIHLEEKPAEVNEKTKSPTPRSSTATPAPPSVQPTAPPSAAPAPAAAPTPPPAVANPPAPAPSAAAPPAPKTWANLAAANSKKWGSAVAQESRGTSEVVPQSSSTGSGTQTPTSSSVPLQGSASPAPGGRNVHPSVAAVQALTTSQCFIKGVVESVSQQSLSNYLTTRFGPIKDMDVVRSKACAFVEFNSLDAARKAIIASLPQAQGGEGGLWIDIGDGQQTRISVETRKERGERPAPRSRGGAPSTPANESRGGGTNAGGGSGFRGRGGGRGGGRGMGSK